MGVEVVVAVLEVVTWMSVSISFQWFPTESHSDEIPELVTRVSLVVSAVACISSLVAISYLEYSLNGRSLSDTMTWVSPTLVDLGAATTISWLFGGSFGLSTLLWSLVAAVSTRKIMSACSLSGLGKWNDGCSSMSVAAVLQAWALGEEGSHRLYLAYLPPLVGAWLGAILVPLDWGTHWQQWPMASLVATLIFSNVSMGVLFAIHRLMKND